VPLHDLALRVLLTPDSSAKASLTAAIASAWLAGSIPLHGSRPFDAAALVPSAPARPPDVAVVHPSRVKSGTKKATVHALVHAESVAIDLSWDIIARFGWAPSTWGAGAAPEGGHGGPALPREFFEDWVRVAAEEASHFLAWRGRLRELGADYGALPTHAGLWESAAETSHSLAARLAIVHCVHEGRGLDVATALEKKFAGDAASLSILRANVAQEVGHVGFAVKWLTAVARWGGAEALPLFHALVDKHFHGRLLPPFAAERRAAAGMEPAWYEPLSRRGEPPEDKAGAST
jgi:uncharacterized ferritin-like protein (DUF455 family)